MALSGHRVFYASLAVIVVTITLTQVTAFYYLQQSNSDSPRFGCQVFVCTLVNFGNSTTVWYNETDVPATWNFYNLTVFIAHNNVKAEWYPSPLNEHFVTSIDSVGNAGQFYWTVWLFCGKEKAWTVSGVGADEIKLANGETLAWAYEIPYSPPVSGSARISSCS